MVRRFKRAPFIFALLLLARRNGLHLLPSAFSFLSNLAYKRTLLEAYCDKLLDGCWSDAGMRR